jgi:outer membrane protein TolC
MKNMKFEDENKEILFQKALEENYQIKNSYLEKEELVKELEWTEEEGKPKLSLSGGYQFPADWFVMVDFSVNLADGGIQQIKEEQKENNIKQKEASISYLTEQLKIEAEHLLDQDEYNLLYLNTQLMALEKEQNKMEILEKQYQQGIINKTQLINARLVIEEKEIKVEQAKDEWLIGHLQLAHFIGFLQEKI